MKNGNWTEYGNRLRELEEILGRLNALTNQDTGAQPPVVAPINQ
jgi:hypothetical protein